MTETKGRDINEKAWIQERIKSYQNLESKEKERKELSWVQLKVATKGLGGGLYGGSVGEDG